MVTGNGRVSRDTLNDFLKGQEENVFHKSAPLALLRQRGRITNGHGGDMMDWLVRFNVGSRSNRPDGAQANFQMPERRKKALLDWGKIEKFEEVTKGEQLKNKGQSKRVDILNDTVASMAKEIAEDFCHDMFQDGNTAGLVDPMFGLLSILGQYSVAAADFPTPTTAPTYANLKMNLGGYGGAVLSGAWPSGKFDHRYHFWTPLQANYKRTAFGGSTWAANGARVIRRLTDYQTDLRGPSAKPDVFLTQASMFTELKDGLDDKQRITVGKKVGLVSLGFTNMVEIDGVEVTSEHNVPEGHLIGLALDECEFCNMQDQLFETDDDYVLDQKAKRFSIDCWGQFKWNPWALCGAYHFGT